MWLGEQEEAGWVARLLDWFVDVMQAGCALPAAADDMLGPQTTGCSAGGTGPAAGCANAGAGQSSTGGGRKQPRAAAGLPAAVYVSALEGTGSVLALVAPRRRRQLLAAVLGLWQRTPLKSQPRGLVLAFWRRLMASPAVAFYQPAGPSGEPFLLQEEAASWLEVLPKFIYQLGSSSSGGGSNGGGATSERGSSGGSSATDTIQSALHLLLDAARFAPPGTPLAAAADALQPQLAPLFCTLLPPSGKPSQQQWRMHLGPLARQPPHVQASGLPAAE